MVGIVGIDQAFHKCVIIDLKREIITFEADGTKVLHPLDPYQGGCVY